MMEIEAKMDMNSGKATIKFDMIEFIHNLSDEEQSGIIESLSCSEQVIKHVTDQIFYGHTENLYCGSVSYDDGTSEFKTAIGYAKDLVIEKADEVARKRIEQLEFANKRMKDTIDRLYQENDQLKRSRNIYY